MQKGQQDTDRFLLIPGQNEGERKFIYRTSKSLRKCHGNLNCAVGIITLAHIHQPGQTADFTQIKIVETEFSTGQGEDDAVRRGLFYEFCVIVSARFRTVTTGNQEEMADGPGFYGFYDNTRMG